MRKNIFLCVNILNVLFIFLLLFKKMNLFIKFNWDLYKTKNNINELLLCINSALFIYYLLNKCLFFS